MADKGALNCKVSKTYRYSNQKLAKLAGWRQAGNFTAPYKPPLATASPVGTPEECEFVILNAAEVELTAVP